jgi:hypothetical protein
MASISRAAEFLRHSTSRRASARPGHPISGLCDPMVHSSVCKTAPNDINWKITIGFEFCIWRHLCWQLCWCFVIGLWLCLVDWQPVTLNRAIHDLTSRYCKFGTGIRLETCFCTRRGNDLVHASELGSRLIKSTIQGRRRGRQRRDSFAPACRSGLRCGGSPSAC